MKKVIQFFGSIKTLSTFCCFYYQKSNTELCVRFDDSVVCALVYSLLKSMFIPNLIITFKESTLIEVIDVSEYCNVEPISK